MISHKYVKWLFDSSTKIKFLGLVGPMGERGYLSTFMVHLGIMGMRVALSSYCDPFVGISQAPCEDITNPLRALLKPLEGIIVNTMLAYCKYYAGIL